MITEQNLTYSRAAASRILGLKYRQVKEVREFNNSVWIYLPGKRPFFMSKQVFQKEFTKGREQRANGLEVELAEDGAFTVRNPIKETYYEVLDTPEGLQCGCHDWRNQKKYRSGWPECKHAIAVQSFVEQRPLMIA